MANHKPMNFRFCVKKHKNLELSIKRIKEKEAIRLEHRIKRLSDLLFKISSIIFGFGLTQVILALGPGRWNWYKLTPFEVNNINGLLITTLFISSFSILFLFYWWYERYQSWRRNFLIQGFFNFLLIAFLDFFLAAFPYIGYITGLRIYDILN